MHIRDLVIRREVRAGGGSATQGSSKPRSRTRTRTIVRASISTVLAMTLTAMLGVSASAHYVYQEGDVWESGTKCLYGRAETSHGRNGGGYLKVEDTAAQSIWSGYGCIWQWFRPAGYLAIKYVYYKWNGSSWALCRQIGWRYNSSSTSYLRLTRDFGYYPDCGSGYYGTMGGHFVRHNGAWNGDWLWSGYHYLSAGTNAATQTMEEPPPPAWVNESGAVDESLVPDLLPVVGADGEVLVDANGDPVMYEFDDSPAGLSPDLPAELSPDGGTPETESRTFEYAEDGSVIVETIEIVEPVRSDDPGGA